MEYLWAPWRMEYIAGKKKKGCFFCKKVQEDGNKENLVLYRGKHVFVVMNKYPYTNGHLMIAPLRHCLRLEQLDNNELKELFDLLKACVRILKAIFRPQGFNIGMNIGTVGGAGEDHLHLHVVPRWAGDTNFMPVIGKTKVVSDYLGRTYQKLHPAFVGLLGKKRVQKGG